MFASRMGSIRLVAGLSAAVALSIAGCAGSSFSSGSGGSGGKQNEAGTSSAGSGNDAGTDSGGTSDAGRGGSTAGQMGGGTGGSSAGAAGSSGGGGRAATCRQDSDCVACAYPTAPHSPVDCYCATCNDVPLAKDTCDANRAEFEKVCKVPMVCPAIACVKPPDPVCDKNMCVAGTTR